MIASIYLAFRNIKVYHFLTDLADRIYEVNKKLINSDSITTEYIFKQTEEACNQNWAILNRLEYNRLFFYINPLKYKYWLTPEELELLGLHSELVKK